MKIHKHLRIFFLINFKNIGCGFLHKWILEWVGRFHRSTTWILSRKGKRQNDEDQCKKKKKKRKKEDSTI